MCENTCGWKSVWKCVKCCLKTENDCLKIQTKHPLNHCGGVYELEKLSLFLRIKESIQSERLRSFQTIYDNCFINEMEWE